MGKRQAGADSTVKDAASFLDASEPAAPPPISSERMGKREDGLAPLASSPHATLCAYCRKARAVTRDHVVPRSLLRRKFRSVQRARKTVAADLLELVPACFRCNNLKGARRLVPLSWASRIPLLNEVFPGVEWRCWNGDTKAPAYADAHRLITSNAGSPQGGDAA